MSRCMTKSYEIRKNDNNIEISWKLHRNAKMYYSENIVVTYQTAKQIGENNAPLG